MLPLSEINDKATRDALTTVVASMNEAIDGIGRVWHLRRDGVLDAVSRESAQSAALLGQFVMPAIKQITSKVNALDASSLADHELMKRIADFDLPQLSRKVDDLRSRFDDLSRAIEALNVAMRAEKESADARESQRKAEDTLLKNEDISLAERVRKLEDGELVRKTKSAAVGGGAGAGVVGIAYLIEKLFG